MKIYASLTLAFGLAISGAAPALSQDFTTAQQAGLKMAQDSLSVTNSSRRSLIRVLSGRYGPGLTEEQAAEVVDSMGIDFSALALAEAKSRLSQRAFKPSCDDFIDELTAEFGAKFTKEEARYAAEEVEICPAS